MVDKEFLELFSINNTEQERAREARNLYAREYRAKNKQRITEAQTRYWARKAEMQQDAGGKAYTLADLLDEEAKNPDGSSKTFGQIIGSQYKDYLEILSRTNEQAQQPLSVLNDMLEKGEIQL